MDIGIISNRVIQVGWLQVGVNWYYLGNDGKMRTGWQKIDGYWYYFNLGDSGKMLTGWQKISSVWYYLGTDGKMCTGWKQVSGKWYYLGADGKMRTGWQTIDEEKYYFNLGDSGSMVVGWKKIDGYYYYFEANGVMRTTAFVDSKCYYKFYASGKLCCVESRITRQVQEKSNWCWAACASMAGEYITGTRISQSDIAKKFNLFAFNLPIIGDENAIKVLNYASGITWNVAGATEFDFQDAVDKLDSKKIFGLHISWEHSGHMVICGGYRLSDQSLRIVDPINDSEPNYYKYYKLRTKQELMSGTGTWDRTYEY